VAGEQRPLDLGKHGVVVADDAGETHAARAQPVEQVVAQFLFDRAELVASGAQLADGARKVGGRFGDKRCGSLCHLGNATPDL
jgi:hypothetical protein